MTLNIAFNILITTSLMGSVTALLILLVKVIFKYKLSPKWHYYIWLLLVLRLMFPLTPSSPISIFNAFSNSSFIASNNIINPNINFSNTIMEQKSTLNMEQNNASIADSQLYNEHSSSNKHIGADSKSNSPLSSKGEHTIPNNYFNFSTLAFIWVIFSLMLITYFLVCYITFIYKINNKNICLDKTTMDNLEHCKKNLNFKSNVSIIMDNRATTPMAIGILKKRILISEDIFNSLSPEEKRYIFYHEVNHLKNKDIIFNWVTTLLLCVHWFNPIIWYCFKRMRADCEIHCDTLTLKCLSSSERTNYGNTILKLANCISSPISIPGTTSMIKKSEIKRRIIMITKYKKASLIGSITAVILTLGISCTSLTNSKNVPLSTFKGSAIENSANQSTSNNTLSSSNNEIDNNSSLTINNSKSSEKSTVTSSNSTPGSSSTNINNNTNDIPAITDEQILELLSNGDTSIRGIEKIKVKYNYPEIKMNDHFYAKLPKEICDDNSLNAFLNKEISLDKFFTDDFKTKLKSSIIVINDNIYYLIEGQAGLNTDIIGGKITSKKASEKSIYIEFTANTIEIKGTVKREALLKYENGKWLIDKFDNWGIAAVRF